MAEVSGIPVVDVGPLIAGDAAGTQRVASQIGNACRDIGFFYVSGHGVPPDVVSRIFDTAIAFFAAPEAVKQSAGFTGAAGNRGYIQLEGERLEPGTQPDIKEAFNIGLELPPDDPDLLAGKPFRHTNPWPTMRGFRETMLDYFDRMLALGRVLHRGFAIDLGLDPRFFDDKLRKPMAILRLLHYPQIPGERAPDQMGAGEHTDYGNVTLLATDEVGGLMIRTRSGEWLEAPVVPDAFICNIGDCLMRWSNDIYVSTPHKVVSPRDRDRYSVAFFLDPDPDANVECLPGCSGPGRPARYKPVSGADFLRARLEPTYAHVET